jgi:hypothetical protein
MLPQQQVQINLNGVYPHRVHLPTFLAWSEPAQEAVFLLLDTGHSGGGSVCGFTDLSKLQRFMGTGINPSVRLGPITALQPPPQSVIHGEFLNQPTINHGNLARATPLSAKTAHVDGVTTSYLLGPRQDNHYPQRLVTFWNTQAIPQSTVESYPEGSKRDKEREGLESIFGHQVTFYTTPITQLSPGDPGIPAQAGNEIALKVILVDLIPRAVAQQPGGDSFSCVVDTGASYNVVRMNVAKAYNLDYETYAQIVLPQLDFPDAQPPLRLLNVPVMVDNSFPVSDDIILGGMVLDHFRIVVLNFGTGVDEVDQEMRRKGYTTPGVSGVIRLIP